MNDMSRFYDMIIVGAGPAGLSAAIYMARAKYKVLVLEKEKIGGQITITEEIVNYPGVKKSSGKELTEEMRKQAASFGAEFAVAEVIDMELENDVKVLHTSKGDFQALSVVLAVGANPRKLGFKGEKEFQGRGVAYCATCDGEFFTGMKVFVLGGGFAAVEEGIFLTKYAKHVQLIVREPDFTCAKTVSDKLSSVDKIDHVFNTEIVEITGDAMPEKVVFKNNVTGELMEYDANEEGPFGVFVFAGYVPNTKWLPKSIELDQQGYIITDRNQKTSLDGVYGAGDVCVKNLRQVVTAVADGAIAATAAEKHVSDMHAKLNIPDFEVKQPIAEEPAASGPAKAEAKPSAGADHGFFDAQMKASLSAVFARFENPVLIKAWLDGSPLSGEIKGFLNEVVSMTDKVTWVKGEGDAPETIPSIEVCKADGSATGIHFHGVPGGHEINSFVIALYNVAGPGQAVDGAVLDKIKSINKPINMKLLVSLSCTNCPETVMASQKIASISEYVSAEMFDINHFPEFKDKYKVMSVPCVILNEEKLVFGKKNVAEVADILVEYAG